MIIDFLLSLLGYLSTSVMLSATYFTFYIYIFRYISFALVLVVLDCDLCRELSIGDLRMMFWTLAIQSSLQQALTGFGATSLLLCLCLNTGGGESQSTSSREVTNCQVNETERLLLFFWITIVSFLIVLLYLQFKTTYRLLNIHNAYGLNKWIDHDNDTWLVLPGGSVQKYSYQFGTSPTCGKKAQYSISTVHNRMARQAGTPRFEYSYRSRNVFGINSSDDARCFFSPNLCGRA